MVERTLQAYKKYKEKHRGITYTKTISREYAKMMLEEAEELLLIRPEKEQNREITYRLNNQILKKQKKT